MLHAQGPSISQFASHRPQGTRWPGLRDISRNIKQTARRGSPSMLSRSGIQVRYPEKDSSFSRLHDVAAKVIVDGDGASDALGEGLRLRGVIPSEVPGGFRPTLYVNCYQTWESRGWPRHKERVTKIAHTCTYTYRSVATHGLARPSLAVGMQRCQWEAKQDALI